MTAAAIHTIFGPDSEVGREQLRRVAGSLLQRYSSLSDLLENT